MPAQARKLTGFAATAVEKARAELAKPKGDAAVAVRAAQQAVGQVGQLLASIDTAAADLATRAELRKKHAAELDQQLQRARSQVSAAQDYITTHRGAVGAGARTRISEAERHLEAAASLAAGDPANATRRGARGRQARRRRDPVGTQRRRRVRADHARRRSTPTSPPIRRPTARASAAS